VQRSDREPFDRAYRRKFPRSASQETASFDDALVVSDTHALDHSIGIVLAGSAGQKVQSAAYQFCLAAIPQGLYCTQKNDNPVTQGSGFSIAEVVISPEPLLYTGIEVPDAILVVSADGLHELEMQGVFLRANDATHIVIDESLTLPPCKGIIHRQAFRRSGPKQAAAAAFGVLCGPDRASRYEHPRMARVEPRPIEAQSALPYPPRHARACPSRRTRKPTRRNRVGFVGSTTFGVTSS